MSGFKLNKNKQILPTPTKDIPKVNIPKPQLPFQHLMNKVNVHVSNKVYDKIRTLCSKISKVEWSGCIFYSIEGSLLKPSEIKIEIIDLIPLDRGSTTFTEYSFDERVMQYMMKMDYFELKIGHIHSHHSMATYFSGTDLSELNENSENMNPYLSIIVNNHGDYACKLAFRGKAASKLQEYNILDIDAKRIDTFSKISTTHPQEIVFSYDCLVHNPTTSIVDDEDFGLQLSEIMKPKYVASQYGKTPYFAELDGDVKEAFDFSDPMLLEGDFNIDSSDNLEELFVYLLHLGTAQVNHNLDLITTADYLDTILVESAIEEYAKAIYDFFPKALKAYHMVTGDSDFEEFIINSLIEEIEFAPITLSDELSAALSKVFKEKPIVKSKKRKTNVAKK